MLSVNPEALRLSEIQRRGNRFVPVQFADVAKGAMGVGMAVKEDQDKKAKAMEFQAILDKGVQGMNEIYSTLPQDLKAGPLAVPDPSLYSTDRDAIVSWYKLAGDRHSMSEVQTALAAGNLDQAEGAAARFTKDPNALIANKRKVLAEEEERKKKDAKTAASEEKKKRFQNDFIPTLNGLLESVKKNPEARTDIATALAQSEFAGEDYAEKFIDNLKSERGINPFMGQNFDLKDKGQTFQQENSLRDEFRADVKSFEPALTAFAKTQKALQQNNATDSYVAIINFVKTLDPTSTVREGEALSAKNSAAGGKWDQFRQWANTIKDGKMTSEVRKNFYQSARALIQAEMDGYHRARRKHGGIVDEYAAQGFKVNKNRVLGASDSMIDEILNEGVPGIADAPKPKAKPKTKKSDSDLIDELLRSK